MTIAEISQLQTQIVSINNNINNLLQLYTAFMENKGTSGISIPVYTPMTYDLDGGGYSIKNILNLQANGSGTFNGTITVKQNASLESNLNILGVTTLQNTLNVQGITTISNTTQSTSVGTGSLIIQGGASVANNFYIGQLLNVGSNAIISGDLTVSGTANLQNVTLDTANVSYLNVSNNAVVTGTLVVSGTTTLGSISAQLSTLNSLTVTNNTSIGGTLDVTSGDTNLQRLHIAGETHITNGAVSNSTGSGALRVDGGVGIVKQMYIGGHVHIQSPTQSNNTSNGALIVTGGAGIAKNVNIGQQLNVTGNTTLTTLTAGACTVTNITTSTTQASVLGYVTVTDLLVNSTSASGGITSGAIHVKGGVGIEKNVYIGTTLNVGTDATITGQLGVSGVTTLATTNISGATNVSSQLKITDTTNVSFNHATDNIGALIVDGGAGIKKDLLVEGYIFAKGTNEALAIRAGKQIAIHYDMGNSPHTNPENQGLEIYNEDRNNTVDRESMITFYNKYFTPSEVKTSRGALSAGAEAIGTDCSGYLGFYTNSTTANTLQEHMRLSSSGHLAIGPNVLTSSAYHLDVNSGSTNICARFASAAAAVRVLFSDTTGNSYIEAREDFRFGNDTLEFMRINNGGNVSIGTTNSDFKLQVTCDGQGIGDGDGIRLNVGSQGDGLTIVNRYNSRKKAFIGQANDTPLNGGQLSLFNNNTTFEDIRLINSGNQHNWIRTASNGHVVIGDFSAAQPNTLTNLSKYSGVTITGSDPSLSLLASGASGWSWIEFNNINTNKTRFHIGSNAHSEYLGFGFGSSNVDSRYMVMNKEGRVSIRPTGNSHTTYNETGASALVIGRASDGLHLDNIALSNMPSGPGIFSSHDNPANEYGSLLLKARTEYNNYSIKFYTYSNTYNGTGGLPLESAIDTSQTERMRISETGNVYIGNTRWSVAKDTSYVVNIARGVGGFGNLILQGDNYSSGNPRLAFKNELTNQGGTIVSASIRLDDNGHLVSEGKHKIITGTTGASVDVVNQENGSIHFTNGSGGTAVPNIVAKSTQNTGLVILTSTPESPSSGQDVQFNVVNNSNAAHTDKTHTAYTFKHGGEEKMSVMRAGGVRYFHNGNIAAKLHFYRFEQKTYNSGGTIQMKTDRTYGGETVMYSLEFKGYDHGSQLAINTTLAFYNYNNGGLGGGPHSVGTHTAGVYKSSDGKVVITLAVASGYYTGFTMSQYTTSLYGEFNIIAETISTTNQY